MGAKTEIKKLPGLMARRDQQAQDARAYEDVIFKATQTFERDAALLIAKYKNGAMATDFFYDEISKLSKESNRKLSKLDDAFTAKKEILEATENEILQIIQWCGARIVDRSPSFVKSKLEGYVDALKKREKALRGAGKDPSADGEVIALKGKIAKWENFTQLVLPKYNQLATELKAYSKQLSDKR